MGASQFLVLTKAEYKLLEEIGKVGHISVENPKVETEECKALYRYGLLQTADLPCYPSEIDGEYTSINSLSITMEGVQYLRYAKAESKRRMGELVRYLVTTVIAILALVLSAISIAAQLGLIRLPST